MPKWLRAFLFFSLLLLVLPGGVWALESISAVEYGAWSAWQEESVAPAPNREIESQWRALTQDQYAYHYVRYIYYNTQREDWFAAANEQSGAHCREGSGYWEECVLDAPLDVTGKDGSDILYGDGWFGEQVTSSQTSRSIKMYRYRTLRPVTCEANGEQFLVLKGQSRTLEVNFYDAGSLRYASDNLAVVTVDEQGLVVGREVGSARVTVRSSSGREVVIEVLVCDPQASIPVDGIYTLRLAGTRNTLAQGATITDYSYNTAVKPFTGARTQRFILKNVRNQTFTLHPLNNRKWYVDVDRNKNKIEVGCNVQATKRHDRPAQRWRAIYVPDGSYIIYSRYKQDLALGVAGKNAQLKSREDLDHVDRWILVKTDDAVDPVTPFARPVALNGASRVQTEYGEGHPGIDFVANERAYVLSAARGTVLEASGTCRHDSPKKPNGAGELLDLCDARADSLGNYVLIDHGGGLTALYAHLSEVSVTAGDTVRQGTIIGRSGATGSTDQVKLYFELRLNGEPIDPRTYIDLPKTGEPITQ